MNIENKHPNKQTKKKKMDQKQIKGEGRSLNKPTIAVDFKRQSGEGKFNSQVSSKPF